MCVLSDAKFCNTLTWTKVHAGSCKFWQRCCNKCFHVCYAAEFMVFLSLGFPWILFYTISFSSVQFSRSVVSDSLRPHESQHTRPPCPSPTPGVHSDSRPSSRWCHPTISSSVVPFSSCLQSFPASGSFQMSQLFTSGGQVLEFQLQHQSFQWTPRPDLL